MAVVPKQNGLNILRKLVPLNTLTEETLAELMEAVAFEKIAKGDFLFRAGDTDPERIYLLSGKVALLEHGKEIDTVTADSNMARYPIAHHIPRKFSVQATTKAEIVRIDSHLLSDLLTRGGNALYQVEELNADADDDWMSQLLQSPVFQRIPAANIQNIMMRMEEVQVSAGEMVIRQGDEGDYFYLINRGQCSITRQRGDGEIEEIAQLGAGYCLGEESLLSGQPRGSTVSMLTDGVLFRLGKKDFVEYIKMPLANAISYDEALNRVEKGAVWLDVRSPHEHQRIHIKKSKNVPFNNLRSALPELDTDKTYIVYCQDGLVSSTAVYLLMEQGLDALVLERGLESVPDDAVKRDKSRDGAEIINLRPEKDNLPIIEHGTGSTPDDEAGLLRERLQKTETQAQEQLQRARKLKLMLEKLKGRLAEAESGEARASEESRRLAADIEKLQDQLKEQEKAGANLKKQQSSIEAQLAGVTGERDQLQEELSKVCQQVGKLEKRLETKQQDEMQLKASQTEAEAELERINSEKSALAEEAERLQGALHEAQAELQKRSAELTQSQQAMEEALAKQQDESQLRASQVEAREELQRALTDSQAELERISSEKSALAEETERLQGALDGAEAELQKRSAELTQAQQAIEEALAKQQDESQLRVSQVEAREELQQALNDSRTELDQLSAEKSALEQTAGQLREALDGAQTELERLRDELAQFQQSSREALAKQQAVESTLQELQEEAAALRRANQAVQQEAEEQRGSLTEALAEATSRIESLEESLAERGDDDAARLEALDTAKKQQRLDHAELEQLRNELEGASARISELDAERQALQQAQRQRQSEQEAKLQQSLYEAVEGRSHAESELRIATDERDRVAAELKVLQKSFGQLQRLVDERDNMLVELQLQIQQNKHTEVEDHLAVGQQQAELDRLTAALDAANSELESARQAVQDKARLLEDLQQTLDTEKAAAERMNAQLEASEQALLGVQQEQERQAESIASLSDERNRLEQQLESDRQRIDELETQLAAVQPDASELDALREELAEVTAARVAAETALAESVRMSDSSPAERNEIKAVQAELETLNDALDEADKAYEALDREKAQLQQQLERLQAEASGTGDHAGLIAQKEAAEQEVTRLSRELEQLREQAKADVAAAESASDEAPAARVVELQAALEQAHIRLKELELGSSADAAECEVLRQDIDKLKRSLDERSAELERTRKESLLLEEKTEERNSEIDRLKLALEAAQVDADEAVFKKEEALAARKQVEESLYALQKQVEHGRPRDDLLDKRLAASVDGLDAAPGGTKQKLVGALVGAVLAFGAAEVLSMLGGNGEIISAFLDKTGVETTAAPGQAAPVQQIASLATSDSEKMPAQIPSAAARQEPDKPPAASPPLVAEQPQIAPAPTVVAKPAAVVTKREPVVAKAPPKPRGPVIGARIQDRLADGGSGPELVYIHGGTFQMGSRINQLASEEQPVHEVNLNSFSIGRYEVTFRDYEQFAAATERPLPDDLGWGQGPRPVINVSWNDARAYTEWLSEQTGQRYRLPTEAEWEYAAAAGTDTPYWWGFELGSGNANCFNCGSEWDGASTAPVGRFEANPFGLHNTAGNVMEWVEDCYHNSYDGAPVDGSSWQEPACRERVVRGGAFNKPGESLRVTRRGRHDVDARLLVLGFRVVREVR